MTKKEAIQLLKQAKLFLNYPEWYDQNPGSMDMTWWHCEVTKLLKEHEECINYEWDLEQEKEEN
jgi:hypothetical protein